jgi:hypothetical protein
MKADLRCPSVVGYGKTVVFKGFVDSWMIGLQNGRGKVTVLFLCTQHPDRPIPSELKAVYHDSI